ncbi:hypothetical protein COCON_G00080560 [Conger conger]|uniref:Rho-GAP domain-containing protein n=1 Tax=Conger conger TaxID=82655 RepID=A0A9Q1I0V6_CONCO|nr:hypothetical protein COCON_G00080560 [Conger conger]
MPVAAPLSSLTESSHTQLTAGQPERPGSEGQREQGRNRGARDRRMPENKQAVSRSSSYLTGATYRRIKRALSFRRRVFGQRLEETVVYERRYGEHMAPLVVEQCVAFIRERGLQELGLFRQPGQATLVKELQEAFDAGEKPSFDSSTDVHTVASLLKLYLRELPEPVVPFSRYQDFLLCGKHILMDRKEGLLELKTLLHELPVANFNLLHYICQFLNEVQSYSSSNKMSTPNLATVFGPNILRPKAEDPESIIGGAAVVQQLMSELIRESGVLFVRERDASAPFQEEVCLDPSAQPHCSCPSEGLPLSPPSPEELGSPHSLPDETGPPRRPSEIEPRLFDTPSPADPVDPLYENIFLSRYHTPPPAPSTPPPPPPSLPVPTEIGCPGPSTAIGWGGEEGRGWLGRERRRASDTQESTLSVYDNMDAGVSRNAGGNAHGVHTPTPDREDATTSADSTSWSSCELLLEDPVASLRTDAEEPRVNSPASSLRTDAP